MVSEAIDELNGVTSQAPAEIKVELPLDAHLPQDYVAREDLRFDAYRRLAEIRDLAAVDELAAEWVDRFGPIPDPAAQLLQIARLRAHCVRTGVTELTVVQRREIGGAPFVARLAPLDLPVSKQMRLERTRKGAVIKPERHEVHLPVPGGADMAEALLEFFAEFTEPGATP
jgi:transcription-repair coupling factor (superfamily II helicase)